MERPKHLLYQKKRNAKDIVASSLESVALNKNVDIKCNAHDSVSEITFILYAQNQTIAKSNNLDFWDQWKQILQKC